MQKSSPVSSSQTPSPDTKSAGDFSSVNAFDREIWFALYKHIDKPATAKAILESSMTMPIIEKLYPALIVRARQTLIQDDLHRARRASRNATIQLYLAHFARLFRKRGAYRVASTRPAKQSFVFPKRSGLTDLNRG